LTDNQFSGAGRIYVSAELRDRIREAYVAAGWQSSRHAAAATAEVGEAVSHQTIESFLGGRWTTTERRVLRALIAIHDLDAVKLSPLVPHGEEPVEWTFTLPRRLWLLDGDMRERIERQWVSGLDIALDLVRSAVEPEPGPEDEVAARRRR
jgi:hypothetical protein